MVRSWCLLTALLLAGCGGKSVEEFCRARFDVMAERDVRCGASADVAHESWDATRDYVCHNVTGLLKAEKVRYDSGKADACLERLRTLPCGLVLRVQDDPCDQAIVGRVESGATCFTGLECTPGSLCAATQCPGTCVSRVQVGGECGGTARCVEGAVCIKGSCVAQGAAGASCRVGSIDCGDGLYCAGATPSQSAPGTCTAAATASSGPCDQPLTCAFGSVCAGLDYATNKAGTCQAPAARGATCTATNFCDAESYCSGGKCTALPRIGEACGALAGGSASCLTGWCHFAAASSQGTCAAFLSPGDACDSVEACGAVARCDKGRCVALCRE